MAGAKRFRCSTLAGGKGRQRRSDEAAKLFQALENINGLFALPCANMARAVPQIRIRFVAKPGFGSRITLGDNPRGFNAACGEDARGDKYEKAAKDWLPLL